MEEYKRVLHVLHSMNCGGAETLIMNIYRNIDRSKIQFDFLVNCFDEMFYEKEIRQLGGHIFRMKFLNQITPAGYKLKLYNFFKRHREYKIIHSHLETTSGIILGCAKKAGIPVRIAHSHNSGYPDKTGIFKLENIYKDCCKKQIFPNSTNLFACSDLAAKWMYGSKSNEAVIIKNGIDAAKYRFLPSIRKEIRTEFGISDNITVIGHAGRFYEQKNHLFLIDAYAEYEKINPNSVLWLAGEGPLLSKIKDRAFSKDISEKVKFLGLSNDMERILQGIDIFLLPSKFEGLPLVLVEAQAAGIACLASDTVSAQADLGCGLMQFLPFYSPVHWAEKIISTNTERKQTTNHIIHAGYDIKNTAKYLEEFYCEMRSEAERGSAASVSGHSGF